MTSSEFIKDVGEVDFEYEVLLYSKSLPVLVYFWADWCKPCRDVEGILERLARESLGSFRLARVNSDANPNLAIRYDVRTLPTLKAFADEHVSSSLIGPQPENRIVHFIQSLAAPGKFTLEIEKSTGYLSRKDWAKAETGFRKVLDEEPENTSALIGLIKSILPQGKAHEALNLLDVFPISREYHAVEALRPLAEELSSLEMESPSAGDDLFPAYHNALIMFQKGKLPIAVDGLMDILRTSRSYRQGKVRQVILGMLEIMGEDEQATREYRAELASILF